MGRGPGRLAIEVKGLTKAFGRTPVLKSLDLEVPWGEMVTVVGPNGSGKTTLVKLLATLTKPDSGAIRLAGLDLSRSGQSARRAIGVVTHDALLYDGLTGHENLRFFARLFGLDHIDERVEAAAQRMAVLASLHQRVGTLSHGMKKRLTIARAVLHDPPVLIMDEPESGLDQEALALLGELLSERTARLHAVLMTTHNLERALEFGGRMGVLANGRLADPGPLDSLDPAAVRDVYFRYIEAAP